MYEQYTDKQIVEMLKPKLAKLGWEAEFGPRMEKLISALYKSGYIRGQLGRSFIVDEKNKWVPVVIDNIKVGDKVRFVDKEKHDSDPSCYPPVGTVGIVRTVCIRDRNCDVQWPKNTTAEPNIWWAKFERLEVLLCE